MALSCCAVGEQPGDLAFLEDVAKWMSLTGDGDDGLHNAVPHQAFWCWNANSGDTGGLVADNWITVGSQNSLSDKSDNEFIQGNVLNTNNRIWRNVSLYCTVQ